MPTQIYIKSSNSLNALADSLVGEIEKVELGVFNPIYIITQTTGMQSWLKNYIAAKRGIAANFIFLKPNDFINKVYWKTGGEFQETLSRAVIQWLIYKNLVSKEIMEHFPKVRYYLKPDGRIDDVKRIALAQELADLFDQYQIYRPEMLDNWEEDRFYFPDNDSNQFDEKWQKILWAKVKEEAGKRFPDKRNIRNSILENIDKHQLDKEFPAVYFFGTSLVTFFHHDILQKISEYIPIHFYLPNPSPQTYWYEDKTQKELFFQKKNRRDIEHENTDANPLLLNWGKVTQDTFSMFFSNDETLNSYEDILVAQHKNTLLSNVQKLIHENAKGTADFSDDLLQDNSIIIRSCFSPAREVETLYNHLVKTIDENPNKYSPRDIVVYVTDINKYASYIRAVFDNAPYNFKYTIADESFSESDTISHALKSILLLDENEFSSEIIAQLLDFTSIKRHFNIKDISLIRNILIKANIRTGIEGSKKDDSRLISWEYGLKRIMYGICMKTENEFSQGGDDFYPLDELESSSANELVRFVYMVKTLFEFLEKRKEPRTVSEWAEFIHKILQRLIYDEEEQNNAEYQRLVHEINEIVVDNSLFKEDVSWQVFLQQLLPGIDNISQDFKFARGGITFCSLIPMRSIPFKVVSVLGLDFDKFPRKSQYHGFDLMAKKHKPGDRNIKLNDKHLFLETVMSARDSLYLSYIGQRIDDNTTRPPSIVVDELLDFIESCYENPEQVKNAIFKEEPLHLFSSKYGNEKGYFNYLLESNKKVQFKVENETQKIEFSNQIDIFRIHKALCNTMEWYYQLNFGIYYDKESISLPETEKFELDHLEKWIIKQGFVTSDLEIEEYIDYQKKIGNLQLKNEADYEFDNLNREYYLEWLQNVFRKKSNEQEASSKTLELRLNTKNGIRTITAQLNPIFDNEYIVICVSNSFRKYKLKAAFVNLLVCALEENLNVVFLSNRTQTLEKISKEEATERLTDLVELMELVSNELHPFDIYWKLEKEKDFRDRLKKQDDSSSEYSEAVSDPYFELFLEDNLKGKSEFTSDEIDEMTRKYCNVSKKLSDYITKKEEK